MPLILYYLLTGIVLIIMFSVLVAAHEFGHYLFARIFNMGVEEFAIGFGKPQLITWMKRQYRIPMQPGEVASIEHEDTSKLDIEAAPRPPEDIKIIESPEGQFLEETTRFTVRAWPLGGFVRIKGMIPEEDGSETTIAGGFYSKAPWKRFIVLLAGPTFSVLAGLAILIPLFMVEGTREFDNKPVIGAVTSKGPAEKAGLKAGDRVVSIDGKPISTFYEMNVIVRDSADKALHFVVQRDSQKLDLTVVPELDNQETNLLDENLKPTPIKRKQAKLKTEIPSHRVSVGFLKATSNAAMVPIEAVASLAGVVKHPSSFKDNVSGPITISRFAFDTVKDGIPSILELAALLSISVVIFNLLPVAPLDGGQMTMAVAEMFRRGKRLSIQVQGMINMVGLMCMCALILGVLFVDFGRLRSGNSVLKDPAPKKATK